MEVFCSADAGGVPVEFSTSSTGSSEGYNKAVCKQLGGGNGYYCINESFSKCSGSCSTFSNTLKLNGVDVLTTSVSSGTSGCTFIENIGSSTVVNGDVVSLPAQSPDKFCTVFLAREI